MNNTFFFFCLFFFAVCRRPPRIRAFSSVGIRGGGGGVKQSRFRAALGEKFPSCSVTYYVALSIQFIYIYFYRINCGRICFG